ncbi:MAG: hypothetical protein Q8K79_21955, partial [Solirubrobacteraceae bacterium]|nr:hypothetical protein [Solirubrobacteraceae bacterium]
MSSRKARRITVLFAGLISSLVWLGVSAGAAHALQALPVTVTGSTNWSVATSLPPAGASTTFSYGTKPLVPVVGDWD